MTAAVSVQALLAKALGDMRAGRRDRAAKAAAQVLAIDPRCGTAWHIDAVCKEMAGDLAAALSAYETAMALSPDEPEVVGDLARLALKMGQPQVAESLYVAYLGRRPGKAEALNNLAIAQRDQMRFAEAVETLRGAIEADPLSAMLWNTLASVLTLQGETEQALTFYDEALRLSPDFASARYNRAMAAQVVGDGEAAIADFDIAIAGAADPAQRASMQVARAKALLAQGRLAEGWAAYAARSDPAYGDFVRFVADAPAWSAGEPLAGKRLLLIGEQGLGDEVLFAEALPDVIEALGPDGRLFLAVEPRLASLFARSFPMAEVGAHESFRIEGRHARAAPFLEGRAGEIDAWAMLGEPLVAFRSNLDRFGRGGPFLKADPGRVAHWRRVLATAGEGRKVGVLWKSLVMDAERSRHFAPFPAWAPVLASPGACFVNLQYGDASAEIAHAAAAFGVRLWTPPEIDLLNDLDDLTALCVALDLVIGPSNATTNLAGAAGAAVWLISTPGAWTRLGSAAYPWYPQARLFSPPRLNAWPLVMGEIAEALKG
jgi:tetratricopeptide (TPR) repeat protein